MPGRQSPELASTVPSGPSRGFLLQTVDASPSPRDSLRQLLDLNIDSFKVDAMTQQLLVRLPEELVRRFKRAVAPRQRSKFVERLLEEALPPDEVSDTDPLYLAALAAEQDEALAAEMAEWEAATVDDGLAPDTPERTTR
jgi:hypothetical protein